MNESILIEFSKQMNKAISAMIELEGMKAANKEREMQGKSLAYGEDAFQALLRQYEFGHNENVIKARRMQI